MRSLSSQAHHPRRDHGRRGKLWITEALPMPVTAMLGAALCRDPARRAGEGRVLAPFADPLMFLFIGSFILARAIFPARAGSPTGVRRAVQSGGIGAQPDPHPLRLRRGDRVISAWISNTATTAMMFAIGLVDPRVSLRPERKGGSPIGKRYATGLMLMTSFAASVGGLATPIGTPPNVIGLRSSAPLPGVSFCVL